MLAKGAWSIHVTPCHISVQCNTMLWRLVLYNGKRHIQSRSIPIYNAFIFSVTTVVLSSFHIFDNIYTPGSTVKVRHISSTAKNYIWHRIVVNDTRLVVSTRTLSRCSIIVVRVGPFWSCLADATRRFVLPGVAWVWWFRSVSTYGVTRRQCVTNIELHQPRLWFITGGYLVKRWFIPAAARARGQSNDLNREILGSNLFNCHKEVINAPPVPSISRCIHIVYRHKNVWEYQCSNFIYNCMSTFLHYVRCKDALLDCSAPGGERCESLTWVDEITSS